MSCRQYQIATEFADLRKVSELTGRGWNKDGEFRSIDIGKGWRVGFSDLDTYRQGHEMQPGGVANRSATSPARPDPSDAQPTARTGKGQAT